jgi:fluoroacetyl-CoA thioesterase
MTEPLENVRVGMTGRKGVVVARDLTIGAHVEARSLYATPMMIMAMEIVSGEAVTGHLPGGLVTVGSEVNIRHLLPTRVGPRPWRLLA